LQQPFVSSDRIEEELLPYFKPRHFLPVEPGKIFGERYKTIAKLGYGGGSTVWLARDLDLYVFFSIYSTFLTLI